MKKIGLLLLIGLMAVLAACGEGNGGAAVEATAGRYIETDITPPEAGRLMMSLLTPEDTLAAFDIGLRTRFDSADGGASWTASPGPGSDTDRFALVSTGAFLPDGRLMMFVPDEGLVIADGRGQTEPFPIEAIDNGIRDAHSVSVSHIQALEDNRVLLAYSVFDLSSFNIERGAGGAGGAAGATGEAVTTTVTARTGGARVQGGQAQGGQGGPMRIGGFGGQEASVYDLATGAFIETTEAPEPGTENLPDGTAFAFGAQDTLVAAVHLLPDESTVASLLTPQGLRLYRYYWDENAVIDPNKTLTIWSLTDNQFVRAAIGELWRRYPDASIHYEVALAGDTAISASDAVRTLNTRLLSGNGPDVLILDGTPIDTYAGRGMLMDLAGRASLTGLYPNLLAPYIQPGGQVYVVPTQFTVPVLMGHTDVLGEVSSLDALADKVVTGNPSAAITGQGRGLLAGIPEDERAAIHFNDLEELFNIMWQANAAAFIHDNQLDSDALRQFLGAIEAISGMYGLADAAQGEAAVGGFVVMGGGGASPRMMPGSLMRYMMQITNFAAVPMDNLMIMQMVMERGEGLDFTPFPGLVEGAWIPSAIVGVSADTNVPDFALAFVDTLLSTSVQGINQGAGLPVTRAGMAAQIETLNEALARMDMRFTLDIDGLVDRLQTPTILENTLRNAIWDSVERLCTGRIDLEGAVREVEQSIRNYLAERS